jgi:hypothetical protein
MRARGSSTRTGTSKSGSMRGSAVTDKLDRSNAELKSRTSKRGRLKTKTKTKGKRSAAGKRVLAASHDGRAGTDSNRSVVAAEEEDPRVGNFAQSMLNLSTSLSDGSMLGMSMISRGSDGSHIRRYQEERRIFTDTMRDSGMFVDNR